MMTTLKSDPSQGKKIRVIHYTIKHFSYQLSNT